MLRSVSLATFNLIKYVFLNMQVKEKNKDQIGFELDSYLEFLFLLHHCKRPCL